MLGTHTHTITKKDASQWESQGERAERSNEKEKETLMFTRRKIDARIGEKSMTLSRFDKSHFEAPEEQEANEYTSISVICLIFKARPITCYASICLPGGFFSSL